MTERAFFIRRSRIGAPLRESRYEYRVWPLTPHSAVSLLHRFWPLTDTERRSDIYFVHPDSDHTLVKLRSGRRLEIKRRHGDVGTVQHWSMPLSTEFPLSAAQLDSLATALSLRNGLSAAAGLSPAHLVAERDAFGMSVVPQTVQKSRLIFRGDTCRAEICRVSTSGWRGLTIALEASDIPSIATALVDLHLGSLPNRSYGEALLRFMSLQTRHRKLLEMVN